MDKELELEVQKLIDAGKSKTDIEAYITDYVKVKKEKAPQKVGAPVEPKSTASSSVNTSLEFPSLFEDFLAQDFEPTSFSSIDVAPPSSTAVIPSADREKMDRFYSIAPTAPIINYIKNDKDKDVEKLNSKKIVPEKIQQITGFDTFGVPTTRLVDKELSSDEIKYNQKIQEQIDSQVSSSLKKLESLSLIHI